jgi:hypothetical protein
MLLYIFANSVPHTAVQHLQFAKLIQISAQEVNLINYNFAQNVNISLFCLYFAIVLAQTGDPVTVRVAQLYHAVHSGLKRLRQSQWAAFVFPAAGLYVLFS